MKVVVASGHLTDEPGRKPPRFPESSVQRVGKEIHRCLDDWDIGRGDLLICGGARGGDLLAAQDALARGAKVRLCLALPVDEFINRSVDLDRTDWVERFRSVEASSGVAVQVQSPVGKGDSVFEAPNDWMVDQCCEEKASSRYALVVWDGQRSGGAGGAQDFAERAARRGISVFGIDPTPRGSADKQWTPNSEPKKLLALDGGGIRGILALGILESIERQLRENTGRPTLVLADYFDYIGGKSTGAIIATALSFGKSVEEIVGLYRAFGRTVFRKNWLRLLQSIHPTRPLRRHIDELVGSNSSLGDPEIRTLLLVVLHNSDSDSPWPLSNCPSALYNRPERSLGIRSDRPGAAVS